MYFSFHTLINSERQLLIKKVVSTFMYLKDRKRAFEKKEEGLSSSIKNFSQATLDLRNHLLK